MLPGRREAAVAGTPAICVHASSDCVTTLDATRVTSEGSNETPLIEKLPRDSILIATFVSPNKDHENEWSKFFRQRLPGALAMVNASGSRNRPSWPTRDVRGPGVSTRTKSGPRATSAI